MSTVTFSQRPFRCDRSQRRWMSCGQLIGMLVPLAVAITLVTPLYVLMVAFLDLLSISGESARIAIGASLVGWVLTVIVASVVVAPRLSTTFGYRIRKKLIARWVFPDNMGDLFFEMRISIGVFVGCQLLTGAIAFFLMGDHTERWVGTSQWSPILLVSVLFLILGSAVLLLGNQTFLQTRGRKLRSWMMQCWRGVALRSFIPAWDNQMRPIFDSCRASKRLAEAYRAIKIGAAGCFAASGCLAATTVGESVPGILIMIGSIVATASVWPTAERIVDWTKNVVDPILKNRSRR